MEMVAPSGPVYQAGTLSGNPVAMAAGLANLDLICAEGFYEALTQNTTELLAGLKREADWAGIPLHVTQAGGMFGVFFTTAERVVNFAQAGQCDTAAFKRFFHLMLERGVYLAPSAYEAGFVSSAHSGEHIAATINAAREAFARMVTNGA
jgi:glutamate-1-semialdehyde 2,1-aminomutase